jgi:surface antigen
MAAIVTATSLVLTASTFPATAATGNRDLASSGSSAATSTSATTGTGTTSTGTTGTSTTGTSTTSTGGATSTGTSATSSSSGTAGDDTVVTTGNTLTYNEGARGYCTWWAIGQFHAYTGLYPDFFDPANNGNAEYWTTDAAYNGWTVTSTPRVDSIAVFTPGVNGAESDGHVAWVTAVSGPRVTITEMNGPAGWNVEDTRTITPAPSVTYILAP